jgi:hypothetical protein
MCVALGILCSTTEDLQWDSVVARRKDQERRRVATGKRENNPNWKGDKVSVRAMHGRVAVKYGSAKDQRCFDCGKQACDWSQAHGTTGLDEDDYFPLCRSCHVTYDMTDERRQKIRDHQTGQKRSAATKEKLRVNALRQWAAKRAVTDMEVGQEDG